MVLQACLLKILGCYPNVSSSLLAACLQRTLKLAGSAEVSGPMLSAYIRPLPKISEFKIRPNVKIDQDGPFCPSIPLFILSFLPDLLKELELLCLRVDLELLAMSTVPSSSRASSKSLILLPLVIRGAYMNL